MYFCRNEDHAFTFESFQIQYIYREWIDMELRAWMPSAMSERATTTTTTTSAAAVNIHYLGNLACVIIIIFCVTSAHKDIENVYGKGEPWRERDKHVLIIGCQTEINSTELIISCLEPQTTICVALWSRNKVESKINRTGERMRHTHTTSRWHYTVYLV